VNAKEKPACVIDLATLTGAIKVGLGADIAGLFCNDDRLADDILDAGSYRGDVAWRMPLFQPYKQLLRSTFADYANASDGFAGAITAALFLELFTGDVPWAHLDIYSWKDGAGGAYAETGGNGQPVQMLTELLTRFAQSADGYDGQGPHEHEQDSND
jgi:leucyl aminopeptidase